MKEYFYDTDFMGGVKLWCTDGRSAYLQGDDATRFRDDLRAVMQRFGETSAYSEKVNALIADYDEVMKE